MIHSLCMHAARCSIVYDCISMMTGCCIRPRPALARSSLLSRLRRHGPLLALLLLCLFQFLDLFIVRRPYGFVAFHEWFGNGIRSQWPDPQPCGWDYEASWKIGSVTGQSPLHFHVDDRNQPAISCDSIRHIPASFVADPFLLIPSNHLPLHPPSLSSSSSNSSSSQPAYSSVSFFLDENESKSSCDLSLADPAPSSSLSSSSLSSTTQTSGIPGSTDRCFSAMTHPLCGSTLRPAPGSPHPTLDGEGRSNQLTDPWYMLYEVKNLQTRVGELGASVSFDHGKRWESVGTIMREWHPHPSKPTDSSSNAERRPLHLSFPHTFLAFDGAIGGSVAAHSNGTTMKVYMIPETNQLNEVRLYSTSMCCFPFGWKYVTTKLSGERFVDTNVFWYEDRWFIFTSVEYSLKLFMTSGPNQASLERAAWIEHPASPLYDRDLRFGRSAGKVVRMPDGSLVRYSQDCSGFYGEKVHMMKITQLTPSAYAEEWIQSFKPESSTQPGGKQGMLGKSAAGVIQSSYLTHRIHHFDWHYIPEHVAPPSQAMTPVAGADGSVEQASPRKGVTVPARWVGVIDGDDIPDDYHFWILEGSFWYMKLFLFMVVLLVTVYVLWRGYYIHLYIIRPMPRRILKLRLMWMRLVASATNKMKWLAHRWSVMSRGSSDMEHDESADMRDPMAHSPGNRAVPRSQAAAVRRKNVAKSVMLAAFHAVLAFLGALVLAAWITGFYPFSMSCTTDGAHGPSRSHFSSQSSTYHNLALASQAYTSAFAWRNGVLLHPRDDLTPRIAAPPVSGKHVHVSALEGKSTSDIPAATNDERPTRLPADVSKDVAKYTIQQREVDHMGNVLNTPRSIHAATMLQRTEQARTASSLTTSTTASPSPSSSSASPIVWFLLGGSAHSFHSLENALGSIHFWFGTSQRLQPTSRRKQSETSTEVEPTPPTYRILVYDLGLTTEQRLHLSCARYVTIVDMDWSAFPDHIRFTATGAWSVLALNDLMHGDMSIMVGMKEGDALIYVDPSAEFRAPPTMMLQHIFTYGHFMPTMQNSTNRSRSRRMTTGRVDSSVSWPVEPSIFINTSPEMFDRLGVDSRHMVEAPLCNAGLIGFLVERSPRAPSRMVLDKAVECAKNYACIFPQRSDPTSTPINHLRSHSFTHSLFSILLRSNGLTCVQSQSYHERQMEHLSADETLTSSLPHLSLRVQPAKSLLSRATGSYSKYITRKPVSAAARNKWTEPVYQEGSIAVVAWRANHPHKPYMNHLIIDRDDAAKKEGRCNVAPDGWVGKPSLRHASGKLAIPAIDSPPRLFGAETDQRGTTTRGVSTALLSCIRSWSNIVSTAASSHLPVAEEPTPLNEKCKVQLDAYRRAFDAHVQQLLQMSASLSPSSEHAATLRSPAASSWSELIQTTWRHRSGCAWFYAFFLFFLSLLLIPSLRAALIKTRWRIGVLVLILVFFFVWIPFYRMMLERWGTFAPWNGLLYSESYSPPEYKPELSVGSSHIDLLVDSQHSADPAYAVSRQALSLPFPQVSAASSSALSPASTSASSRRPPTASELLHGPPAGWRPPGIRVVVSFTTMPHHVDKLSHTIDSLLAQTLIPDAIYLNLPRGRNKRTNQSYEVLPYLNELSEKSGGVFQIIRCEDVGPLTKLVPTLDVETDPQTIVITVDSDKVYPPPVIATLAWRSYWDPRAAFGVCGWGFYWQPPPMEVVPLYIPSPLRGKYGRVVDVLQACCGNVYRRAFFADLELLRTPHPKCFTTDDLWIAGYLATRAHVRRAVIGAEHVSLSALNGDLEPSSPPWKKSDPSEWQLSSHNSQRGVDMGCIRGVEERLGPWRQVRLIENQQVATSDDQARVIES